MVNYHAVAKTVEPKRKKVADAEKNLRTASKDLVKTQEEVATLNEELLRLNRSFSEKSNEQQELQDKAELMERRLTAASKLIIGLSSEQKRWSKDMQTLSARQEFLVGDCLMTSAFLSYTGSFTFEYRKEMIYGMWLSDIRSRGLPISPEFRVEDLLTNEVEMTAWASDGLPSDELSVQNGILTLRSSRFPLCIDPQMQAVSWIKRMCGKELEGRVKTFNDSDFLKQLELAIQYGFPFLFENLDEYIDPVIDSVLEKTVQNTTTKTIQLGDKEVEWDDNFRLYMTSKLANPHYTPEVAGKTMIINYSVTSQGLSDQLLNVTVRHERPDLEEQREQLVIEMSDNKAQLARLEDTLLFELSNASGNILDNYDLIATLERAKASAVDIAEQLQQAKVTAQEIDDVRAKYSPAARRGAVLFFVMAGLANITNMYEYSLESFLTVFTNTLATSKRDTTLDGRLQNIIEAATYDVYRYTCLGLFERHKLMLSFQIAVKVMDESGLLNHTQLDFFLKGNLSLEKEARKNPYTWLSESGWHDLMRLATLAGESGKTALNEIPGDIEKDEDAWKVYFDLDEPEASPLPNGFEQRVNEFEKLLVLRCIKTDRVTIAVTRFVIKQLGEKYVQPPLLDYASIFRQSTCLTPVIFVLSPGADPAYDLFKLGDECGFKPGSKLKYMALGQGMGPRAQEAVEMGATRGLWVMLQNCHLLPKWLKSLEKILEKITHPHKDFRLWLTTDPTDAFPLGILQRSLKVVTEPPNGLKLNMRSSYSKISDEILLSCPHKAFRPLVYVLAFFHANVQERRKYGKLGWNVPYDFNETDFRISMALIGTYLTKAFNNSDDLIPWGTLRYLIGEAMYGGRVSDSFDRRVLTTYLDEYLGDFLFDEFQRFHFFVNESVDYSIPELGSKESYTEAIEALPLVQTPEVFGLHANADIQYYTNATKSLWRNLMELQPRKAGTGTAATREAFIANTATDILQSLYHPFDLPVLRKELGVATPTQVVLLQELERWNQVLAAVRTSLKDVLRALAGEIGLSGALEDLSTSLFNGRVPALWAKMSPETEKGLGSWMLWFHRRFKQYEDWVEFGEPRVMWLSGLHSPETYIAALIQTACRQKGWPLDKSTLYTNVTKFARQEEIEQRPLFGCYVTGLFLEGAGWDQQGSVLRQQDPKVLVTELPVMQIIPVEASKLKLANTFRCPVYVTQNRRNAMGKGFVMNADLATHEHESHWVLQGVALSLNTSD
eukprot:jgi/Ulvmu1/10600/UM065_0055.1